LALDMVDLLHRFELSCRDIFNRIYWSSLVLLLLENILACSVG
jgi:hypothetical protein